MKLYLVQHGEAKKEEQDAERSLTEKGISDIKKVARFLQDSGVIPDTIFCSSKKRAIQTAGILLDFLKSPGGAIQSEGLLPNDAPLIWIKKLENIDKDIMLVGHLPHLSRLISIILCGDKDKKLVEFKYGCIVCLKRENNLYTIEWMILPELIS
jgi:phosphohistidine phosphatase